MSKFQKIIIALCLIIIVILGAATVVLFTGTSEAIKINGTFADISLLNSDNPDFDNLPHKEISIDATLTGNIFGVTGASGKITVGDTEYALDSASSRGSVINIHSLNNEGSFDVNVKLEKGTGSAIITVLQSQNSSDSSMWAGPATDSESLKNVLEEQNIINYSNTETVKEISCMGDFVDINNDYSVDMYEQLPHKTVSVNAKILRNIYGREYADGTLTLDGKEYRIQGFNRDNSFGKNRIFISVITSDGKNAAPGITICYTEGSDYITVNSRLQNNTCYLIGAVKDKNEFETALKELGYIQ